MPAKATILTEGYANNEKRLPVCKKCRRPVRLGDKCACRPWLCYRCCECGLDCDNCSCSHKRSAI